MKLKNEVEYVFRIFMYLTTYGKEDFISSKEISDKENIPHLFTLRILKKIQQKGYLEIQKGAKGGYKLTKNADNITLKDAVECIENHLLIKKCLKDFEKGESYDIIVNKILEVEKNFSINLNNYNFSELSDEWLLNK